MTSLARATGLRSADKAAKAYGRLTPQVLAALTAAGRSPSTVDELLVMARAFTWVERDTPEVFFGNDETRFDSKLAPLLFGESLPAIVSGIVATEEISEHDASAFVEISSVVALSVVSGSPDQRISRAALMEAVGAHAPQASTDAPDIREEIATATTQPVRVDTDPTDRSATAAAQSRSAATSALVEDGEQSKLPLLIGAAVAVVAILGIGFAVLGGGSDDPVADQTATAGSDAEASSPSDSDTPDTDDGAPPIAVAEVDPEAEAESRGAAVPAPSDEADSQEGDSQPAGAQSADVVSLSVPMVDIFDADRGASGVLNFDFDTATGEVCYSVESINIQGPYRTHIHVGEAGEKGGIVVDMGALDSGDTGCVDNLPIDTNAILAAKSGHYAELHDISEDWTIRGQLSEATTGDLVSLSVPMVDIFDADRGASGVLNFDFDTATGEVCYSVESINIQGPYRTHIHVGEAGEKGGIVVDMGALDSGDTGCVDNLPIDTNAILAAKSGHYAELHDISEDWTIRGQLSEATTIREPDEANSQVDVSGGGASIVLDGGTVYLNGAVPDQATADELTNSLSGINAATPVVNNLTVEPGAPLPSGRVVIADAVFFAINSSEVKAIDNNTLSAITALALSREDWILTVVGHTDSDGSDVSNLELSLRRASALRDLLAAQGVPEDKLRIRGAGETAPIGDNETWSGRAKNRRIEFEFTPSA